jgi:hypothetical protein
MTVTEGHRRIDRIIDPAFLEGLEALPLDELRGRRDECMAEREYLSLLRRLVQGRLEILRAEQETRRADGEGPPVVDRLPEILGSDEVGEARGEVVRVGVPEEELLLARRLVERLVADAGVSDPSSLDDAALEGAIETFADQERIVSGSRHEVIGVLDRVLDELKRRYKDDPTLALT